MQILLCIYYSTTDSLYTKNLGFINSSDNTTLSVNSINNNLMIAYTEVFLHENIFSSKIKTLFFNIKNMLNINGNIF